ncbi:MAG: 3-dehydroquinate dehydratase [Dehalococcoidia bacterium]|nr:MAG: 3-dehydroquinate dehydratase [Dehalococcoidia bacterium]
MKNLALRHNCGIAADRYLAPLSITAEFLPHTFMEGCEIMTKILILHGAGMNMRGKSQISTFGTQTLDDYDKQITEYANQLGVETELFHSNIEGEVVNKLYEGHEGDVDAALINPAGYSNGYPALLAAIAQVEYPVFEIHISNPASRGGTSQVSGPCKGVIAGFGLYGYYLGMSGALEAL